MKPIRRQSLVEQTVAHLREGFGSGQWSGQLPGVLSLASELGVSKDTLRDALQQLEDEGLVKSCGAGKRREIVSRRTGKSFRKVLRIGIFLSEPLEGDNAQAQHQLLSIKRVIQEAGHACFFASETLSQLGYKCSRVARVVKAANADAWVVSSGSSDVLEWFAAQPLPVCAFGGRAKGLPLASSTTDAGNSMGEIIRNFAGHGHRRIVLICPFSWRRPTLGPAVTAFLAALETSGISVSDYNVPHWDESAEGLERLLESLFRVTPPTALLLIEPLHCAAVLGFLAQRGIQVPRDLSLACLVPDPVFAWRRPPLAQFIMPLQEHVHRIARWVDAVSCGMIDLEQKSFIPTFDPGGTIAAARKSGR
ncbi:MAG: substrate-binding domain-containing protein [Verrucomicrobiota bacterium]